MVLYRKHLETSTGRFGLSWRHYKKHIFYTHMHTVTPNSLNILLLYWQQNWPNSICCIIDWQTEVFSVQTQQVNLSNQPHQWQVDPTHCRINLKRPNFSNGITEITSTIITYTQHELNIFLQHEQQNWPNSACCITDRETATSIELSNWN